MPSVAGWSSFGALYTATVAKITISVHYWHMQSYKKCTLLLNSSILSMYVCMYVCMYVPYPPENKPPLFQQ